MLRVLLVDRVAALWGAERVLLELAPRLRHRGIELTLGGASDGSFPTAWRAAGLPVLPLPLPEHRAIRTDDGGRSLATLGREAALSAWGAASIARHARRFDVIHSNQLFAHPEVALAGRLTRRPTVIHVHDLVTPGGGLKLLAAACRQAGAVVVAAAAIGRHVGVLDRPTTHVVHPAFDLEHFSPGPADSALREELGAGPDDVLLGMLGRLDPVKGIDATIRALALADRPDLRLVVLGEPFTGGRAYADGLRRLAEEVAPGRVAFQPSRSDVVPVLRSLDVLVNASHQEPFGTSIAEAQACAKAVVATDVGGVAEHVDDGVDGLLVPDDDPEAMAAAFRRLTDPELRASLGSAARRMIEANHDIEDAADRLAAVYRQLVDQAVPA